MVQILSAFILAEKGNSILANQQLAQSMEGM